MLVKGNTQMKQGMNVLLSFVEEGELNSKSKNQTTIPH